MLESKDAHLTLAGLALAGILSGSYAVTSFAPTEAHTSTAAVVASDAAPVRPPSTDLTTLKPIERVRHYVEVVDSCGADMTGTCVVGRAEPSTTSPAIVHLRKGVVLEVSPVSVEADNREWYQVVFNEWLRYDDRLPKTWYVAADYVETFTDVGPLTFKDAVATTTKRIVINRTEQKLYAYDGDTLALATPISTGLDLSPTPRGNFMVYYKTPSRYMQGPILGENDDYYDLPGVPWDLYFTEDGGAIHGAYWHDNFGSQWSHGCVNLPLAISRKLYDWAPVGTPVIVTD